MKLKFDNQDEFAHLYPEVIKVDDPNADYEINWWKIDQTISELAYLTHGFFRYYGKFPPTIVSYLINKYPCPTGGCLLDNFAGSGTSLVEASRNNIPSVGIDINPLACLAGKVKTTLYSPKKLHKDLIKIQETFNNKDVKNDYSLAPNQDFLEKWFFNESCDDIIRIKSVLVYLGDTIERDFFTLAFLAVIRRLSKAYDGEVRPHLNKNKKMKDPLSFFIKKATEMIQTIEQMLDESISTISAETILADSRTDYTKQLKKRNYWLVVSHPPYLNCFDYIPVFKLELEWAQTGFDFIWNGENSKSIRNMELKSWPAKDNLINSYYEGLKESYEIVHRLQVQGNKLAIVIGDCTINKVLEPVHKKLIGIVEKIGYKLIELNYRTTSYSTGKYAYKNRADYESSEKRDAIMIFEKK